MLLSTKEELEQKVLTAIESVRPFLLDDMGDVEFVELNDDMVVKVRFLGSCVDCSMSAMTMKFGLEKTIKKSIPEIKEVISVG